MAQTADIEAMYQLGFELRAAGRYGLAKGEFQKILALNPKHCNARWQMALILGFEGDFDGSLVALEKLSSEFPANDDVRYDYAMTQMMLGYIDEACANFTRILTNNPGHEKTLQQIVYCS
jgi:tetratricopeptide (TPR) repeat protein